jgi:nucleoside-diphosphate-sugar epimerase
MTAASGDTALVTGGCGLLGSAVVRQLAARGMRVVVVDSAVPGSGYHPLNLDGVGGSLTVHRSDVRDAAAMERLAAGATMVMHLAGLTSHAASMADPLADLDVNVRGTLSMLEACRKACPAAAFVFASTRQVYGRPDRLPVAESHPVRPPDVNAINKVAAEQYCALYHRIHGLRTCVLRLTNVYGPGLRIVDAKQMFLGIWLRNALEGRPIQVFGDGAQRRDLLYVDDAAEAVVAATRAEAAGGLFNVGRDDTVSLQQLAQQVSALAGGTPIVNVPFPAERKAIDIGDYATDGTSIRRVLGWFPRTALADGLAACLAHYRRHLRTYIEGAS